MKLKKILTLLLSLTLGVSAMASCGGEKQNESSSGNGVIVDSSGDGSSDSDGAIVGGDGSGAQINDATLLMNKLQAEDDVMQIVAWGENNNGEAGWKDFTESGMAISIPIASSTNYNWCYNAGSKKLADYLQAAEEAGTKVWIMIHNGWQHRGNGRQLGQSRDTSYFYSSLQSFIDAGVDYTEYESFLGFMPFDEPGGNYGSAPTNRYNDYDFLIGNKDTDGDGVNDSWEFEIDELNAANNEAMYKRFWGNDYTISDDGTKACGPSQWELYKSLWEKGIFKNGTYEDYWFTFNHSKDSRELVVSRLYPFFEEQGYYKDKLIYFDYYYLAFDTKKQAPDMWNMLSAYQEVANTAKEHEAIFGAFIAPAQLDDRAAGVARGDNQDGVYSESDIQHQAYSALCLGAKSIGYFQYAGGWSDVYMGVVSTTGGRTACFEPVKNTNEELQSLFKAYAQFDWVGTMTKLGTRNLSKDANYTNECFDNFTINKVSGHRRITEYSTSRDTLVGCYGGKGEYEGLEAFLFMNFEDPYYKRTDKVSVTFQNATKAVVYVDGEPSVKDLVDGKLEFTIACGDAVFVIPVV